MAGIGDFFGRGSIGEQFLIWGVLQQVVGALIDPAASELQQLVREASTLEPLSPTTAAAAAIRGYLSTDAGKAAAARSGIDSGKFDTLMALAGDVPAPELLVEGLRRGILSWDGASGGFPSVQQSLTRIGVKAEYHDLYRALAVQLPTWNDALDALLEGQLDRDTAKAWYLKAGGDPDAFDWLFDARGSAPTPVELGTMANRGIIPWDGAGPAVVSFHQGFLEGPWRNKWEAPMRKLAEYRPPPRTVTALLREGEITEAEALTLFKQAGLSPTLAAAYVKAAEPHHATTAKVLTQAQIVALYEEHVIDEAKAKEQLTKLGYDAATATLILSGADVRRNIANTTAAVSKIKGLYIGHKITAATAAEALKTLGVTGPEASRLTQVWELERQANVRTLTPAQIGQAFKHELITQEQATAELRFAGYDDFDAWVILSLSNGEALPNKPAQGPA